MLEFYNAGYLQFADKWTQNYKTDFIGFISLIQNNTYPHVAYVNTIVCLMLVTATLLRSFKMYVISIVVICLQRADDLYNMYLCDLFPPPLIDR